MIINLSNHPSDKWGKKQTQSAVDQYGSILDFNFPNINPLDTSEIINELAKDYFNKIALSFDQYANEPKPNAVHIMGEFTFVFNLVTKLKSAGIICVASTSNRNVKEIDGKKIVEFDFIQFREF